MTRQKPRPDHSSHIPKHKTLVIFGAIFGALILLMIGVVLLTQQKNAPLFGGPPPEPTFEHFELTSELGGNTIATRTFDRFRQEAGPPWAFEYHTTYAPGEIRMYQRADMQHSFGETDCNNTIVGTAGENETTCKTEEIDGGRYAVIKKFTASEITEINVAAVINQTKIVVLIPQEALEAMNDFTDWKTFFETREVIPLEDMPFTDQTRPAPPPM